MKNMFFFFLYKYLPHTRRLWKMTKGEAKNPKPIISTLFTHPLIAPSAIHQSTLYRTEAGRTDQHRLSISCVVFIENYLVTTKELKRVMLVQCGCFHASTQPRNVCCLSFPCKVFYGARNLIPFGYFNFVVVVVVV